MKQFDSTLNHSEISPSGHVSKRTREARRKHNWQRLLDADIGPKPPPQPTEAEALRKQAAQLRELADRGMSPTKHRRQAARLEDRAADLAAQHVQEHQLSGHDTATCPSHTHKDQQ